IAIGPSGNLYIVDSDNNRVREVTPDGMIRTVAGTGAPGAGGDGGPAVSAQLNFPYGIARDAAGNLYIADHGNHRVRMVTATGIALDAAGNLYIADSEDNRVRKVAPNGVISTFAGTGDAGFTGDDGPAASAQINGPEGIVVDTARNVYISENSVNDRIRKVSA